MMRCLPYNAHKAIIKEGFDTLVLWHFLRKDELHSFNDQPSYVCIKDGIYLKERSWREDGYSFREYNKPCTIDYEEDGSLKDMYFNNPCLPISEVHIDYQEDVAKILSKVD